MKKIVYGFLLMCILVYSCMHDFVPAIVPFGKSVKVEGLFFHPVGIIRASNY